MDALDEEGKIEFGRRGQRVNVVLFTPQKYRRNSCCSKVNLYEKTRFQATSKTNER